MPYANIEFRRAYDRARNKKRKPHTMVPQAVRERRYLTAFEHGWIKRLRKAEVPMTTIARMFEVSYSCVTGIVYGRKQPRKRR